MEQSEAKPGAAVILDREGLDRLLETLVAEGYRVLGPVARDGAVTYAPVGSTADLPVGLRDRQEGGIYRLESGRPGALFDYVHGPHTWKHHLFPPEQRLWRAERDGRGFRIESGAGDEPPLALVGVRACELRAMAIQDRVFDNGQFAEPGYLGRRGRAFVVAVNCTRAGGTCFCSSMHADGPHAGGGYDLALTEVMAAGAHWFLAESGSESGARVLERLPGRAAAPAERSAAFDAVEQAVAAMGREMPPEAVDLLRCNVEHPRWDDVAGRCLSCGNCTLVCPTCFCSTVEDVTDLAGDVAERWRRWDSCFNLEFSYIHGGSVRRQVGARYRQWITHKLSTWWEQFGSSGCVGCGRCITWCPVGIDITAEVRAIRDSEERG